MGLSARVLGGSMSLRSTGGRVGVALTKNRKDPMQYGRAGSVCQGMPRLI
jgi:hypothetical protein